MWLSVQEAKEKYSKSESSIRRVIKELKQKDLTLLKFEVLPNGMQKVFIESSYFESVKKDKKTHSQNNSSNDIVTHLLNEISEKNKQIESLIERNRESNILLSQLQNKVLQLDEAPGTKKRWWQRKK
jgi:hypothetical protein